MINKIVAFMKKKKQLMKMIIFKSFALLTPLVMTLLIFPFPLFQKINLKPIDSNEMIRISDREIIKPNYRSLIADIIQIPLNLRWYDIYVVNKSKLKDANGCLHYEQPVLTLIFKEGNPDKYSNSGLEKVFEGKSDYDYRIVPNGQKTKFTYASTDGFVIKIMFGWKATGCIDSSKNVENIDHDYEFFAQPNLFAWFIKLIIIYIFWVLFLPSLLEFIKLLRK